MGQYLYYAFVIGFGEPDYEILQIQVAGVADKQVENSFPLLKWQPPHALINEGEYNIEFMLFEVFICANTTNVPDTM